MTRLFADTSYFIAIIAPNDALHQRARRWVDQPVELVTTAWVMTEVAAYFAAPPNRQLFNKLLKALRSSPMVKIVHASEEAFDRGAALYAQRPDKAWSLADCISFLVMQQENITEALTGDRHFEQAGFKALLLNDNV